MSTSIIKSKHKSVQAFIPTGLIELCCPSPPPLIQSRIASTFVQILFCALFGGVVVIALLFGWFCLLRMMGVPLQPIFFPPIFIHCVTSIPFSCFVVGSDFFVGLTRIGNEFLFVEEIQLLTAGPVK